MIKIAVCDDEKQVRLRLLTIIQQYFNENNREVWVAGFKKGEELLNAKTRFDIIFLDIEMPELNGIETAKILRKWDVTSKIIYVTNYDRYQRKAYEVHAFDYISKPVKDKNIYKVLDDAVRYLENSTEKQKCVFETEEGIATIEIEDIYYFEYSSRRVIIHTAKGNYNAAYSLKELYEKFSKNNFESPHKSFIVNLLYVKRIKGFDILLENGDIVPSAQKRAVEFKNKFNDFLQSTFDRI